ncbi:DUF3169 family protein [Streptococcus suis]
MKNGKQLTTGKRILRFLGFMLLSGICGGTIGFLMGSNDFKGLPNGIPADSILWFTRPVLILLSILTAYFLWQARKLHTKYLAAEAMDDDLVDELYPKTFRYLEYATILYNVAISLALFNILLGLKFTIKENGAAFSIPFDYAFFILMIAGQILVFKTTQKIRNYKLSAFPTVKEVKDYMYSLDEGEKQANFEQAFVIQFNLNQRVLPILYLVVFFIEMVTQTNQLVAYAVILFIHAFINIMQYRMVRRYFK